MPIVGNKKFDYTPEGKAAAKAYAKKTGLPMSESYNKGGYVGAFKGEKGTSSAPKSIKESKALPMTLGIKIKNNHL